jgi:2-keto-4-pentenoate hydratase/2-oxohepta-3-ene-1,7-dioic acid hydratase in catechol pathway
MNFSRKNLPGVVHVGCEFGDACLDVTRAISDGLLKFPGVALTLEEVIQVKDGFELLTGQLRGLERSSGPVRSCLFNAADAMFHAPVTHPQKVIGIGLNYRDHATETKLELPKRPLMFGMFANAIIGPAQPIVIPALSKQVDYEAELGVIIGRRGRHVSVGDALQYVAGYTIVNDVSARNLQFSDGQWLRGKSFDTFLPMGPCLVPPDALGDGDGLGIQLRLNGQVLQNSNTGNMVFKVPELVSFISEVMTLEPGDVIATGTPAGVGFARNPQVFMKSGDIVEIEIEGIGVLTNPVVDFE